MQFAGDNRSELETVLDHYQNDSKKLFAAQFLIMNMLGHTELTGSSIDASVLKRNPHGKIPELNVISENMNEEDNPVICLFKLQ